MLEFSGKYASCKVMIDSVEETAIKQIRAFLDCPAFEGAKIRIMPDVHAGAGAVIGFTSSLTDKIIPNVVGVDIGCGIASINLGVREVDFAAFDAFVRANVPRHRATRRERGHHRLGGFSIHEKLPDLENDDFLSSVHDVSNRTDQHQDRVLRSLGTLGGGNHFIELGQDEVGATWLTVHTGSRNFGLRVATWHQDVAVKACGEMGGLEWLEGDAATTYRCHMMVAQSYAALNREIIFQRLVEGFFAVPLGEAPMVESIHNYIDFRDRTIRKGAIAAHAGQQVVIPWNMRDGLIIGVGKGAADWNESAPHGAGRVMGRGQAKRTLKVEDFTATMAGVWSSCVGTKTLDEAPMVYKDHDAIEAALGDTVEILHHVKPVYNFKAV
jgi:RNA-splicing ligase RtcB